MRFLGYRCSLCGAEYGPGEIVYRCPGDGGCLDVVLDYRKIRNEVSPQHWQEPGLEPSQWRYLPLLPVEDPGGRGTPLRRVGGTPVYSLPELRRELKLKAFWLKDEAPNPTASLKDRASSLVVARAGEIGAEVVVTASTGNAGAALAGMAACLKRRAVVFAPRGAPPAKLAQMLVFGARVILVEGSYDQASALSLQAAQELGWYSRNTGYNPFTAEGKKTAALEIWESIQRRQLELPEGGLLNIFVSVGDGNIISGLHKGFRDLAALGWLSFAPRLFGVQAEGSAAVARAYREGGEELRPVRSCTLADSIAVDMPADGLRALRAARQTGGAYLTVRDEQILAAISELGRVGVFAEPAAAAAYAGLAEALRREMIGPEETVLVLNTGSGLKDVGAARQAVGEAPVIEPTMKALKALLRL